MKSLNFLLKEFLEHLPFATGAAILAFAFVFLSRFIGWSFGPEIFEGVHFSHLFFSAFATSAVYARYKNNFVYAILIGVFGAILIGSISDVIFPYLGALIFGIDVSFHLPIFEESFLVLLISGFGALAGRVFKVSHFSHSFHVFLSVFASLFYLVSFSVFTGLLSFLVVLLLVILAVWLPCCLSDLWFPLLFVRDKQT